MAGQCGTASWRGASGSAGDDQSGCSPFIAKLVRIRQDPKTIRQARSWAGSKELAEDALQETFYRLATTRDPSQILNLRAYFYTTLYNAINEQRSKVVLVDPAAMDPWHVLGSQARDVPELAYWHIRCEQRQSKFRRIRDELLAVIPATSPDPARYRALILAIVWRFLTEAFYGGMSRAELNVDLRAGYPEWFVAPGLPDGARHKRLSRARSDIKVVLTTVDPDWEVTL